MGQVVIFVTVLRVLAVFIHQPLLSLQIPWMLLGAFVVSSFLTLDAISEASNKESELAEARKRELERERLKVLNAI